MTNMEQLLKSLDRWVQTSHKVVAELAAKLDGDDPLYALAWGEDAVKAAARIRVARRVRAWAATASYEEVIAEAQREVLSQTTNPSRSTSPMQNLAQEYETAAMAAVARHGTGWGL